MVKMNPDGSAVVNGFPISKELVAEIKAAPVPPKRGWYVWNTTKGSLGECIKQGRYAEYHGEEFPAITLRLESPFEVDIRSPKQHSVLGQYSSSWALGWYNG